MKKMMKRFIAALIALIITFCYMPTVLAYAAETPTDSVSQEEQIEPEKEKKEFKIKLEHPIKKFLSKHNVLSYKYRYEGDYYYCDINNAWQKRYGYTRMFDVVAPYILLEYDYMRVHFTYEGKDWLVQFWKGQYGTVFFGSEIGLYLKESDGKSDSYTTHYRCPNEDEQIIMQTNLYRKNYLNGEYVHQFSTPKESTWWSTGFKPGHLIKEEPADELRLTGSLTFKDEGMTDAFVKALEECGLPHVQNENLMGTDSFYQDGCDVYFSWQNLSEAENTMVIKSLSGTMLLLNSGLFFGVFALGIGIFGALSLLAIIIL